MDPKDARVTAMRQCVKSYARFWLRVFRHAK
jgi:hypothetical protein